MNKVSRNEKGFSAIEIVLVIVVIALIGAAAWLVYKDHHKTTTTSTPLSVAAVTSLLNSFYNQYITANKSTSDTQAAQMKQVIQELGTSSLVNYAYPSTGSYPENPIICAQDIPNSFSVADVTTTPTSGTGTITELFGSNIVKINATVVSVPGNMRLNTIMCNPALTPQQGSS